MHMDNLTNKEPGIEDSTVQDSANKEQKKKEENGKKTVREHGWLAKRRPGGHHAEERTAWGIIPVIDVKC